MVARFLPAQRSSLSWYLLCALLLVFCVAGGASRLDVLGQVLVRLAAIGALITALLAGGRERLNWPRPVVLLLAAATVLTLLQLIPLPPSLWMRLPGREVFAEADAVLGRAPGWRPLALAPGLAINAAGALLAPLAVLVLVAGCSPDERRRLPAVLFYLALASAVLAVLQASGAGFANPLVNDTPGEASGFFANRNHLALFLAQACLLSVGWAFAAGPRRRWKGPAALGAMLLFLLTILATGSRAGILLGALALVVIAAVAHREVRTDLHGAPSWVVPAVIATIIALIAIAVLASVAADRAQSINRAFAVDTSQDIRGRALPTVLAMVQTYFPVGSGAGSFDPAFRLHEPFALLKPTFFNHAHNDFLEILLDFGLPGVLLLAAGIGWWAWASVRAWRAPERGHATDGGELLPKLGSALILLVLVAGLFDYAARTPMIMGVLVIAAVWLADTAKGDGFALPSSTHHL